jgi:hypothetical protein
MNKNPFGLLDETVELKANKQESDMAKGKGGFSRDVYADSRMLGAAGHPTLRPADKSLGQGAAGGEYSGTGLKVGKATPSVKASKPRG